MCTLLIQLSSILIYVHMLTLRAQTHTHGQVQVCSAPLLERGTFSLLHMEASSELYLGSTGLFCGHIGRCYQCSTSSSARAALGNLIRSGYSFDAHSGFDSVSVRVHTCVLLVCCTSYNEERRSKLLDSAVFWLLFYAWNCNVLLFFPMDLTSRMEENGI